LAPSRPPFGPARLEEVFAFLEWRATEDLLAAGGSFLHAAGLRLGGANVLIVGESGAGKSTLAAHLLARGHLAWGDDLVRFAPESGRFSASPRSWKLDANALLSIDLLSFLGAEALAGTLLASGVLYASPAAFRQDWRAPDGTPDVVLLLEKEGHQGPPRLEPVSEGEAALRTARMLIGGAAEQTEGNQADRMLRVLEALSGVKAYRARGTPAAALAAAVELELVA
jgi:hypothetical protein